jgi:hypothetical protein
LKIELVCSEEELYYLTGQVQPRQVKFSYDVINVTLGDRKIPFVVTLHTQHRTGDYRNHLLVMESVNTVKPKEQLLAEEAVEKAKAALQASQERSAK